MHADHRLKTLLCVDSNAQALFIRKQVLEAAGYEVLTAAGREQALQTVKTGKCTAVILDYQLPGADGGRLAEEIKSLRPEVPILIYGSDPYPPPAVKSKVAYWLQKIEGPAALLDALRRIIDEHGHDTAQLLLVAAALWRLRNGL